MKGTVKFFNDMKAFGFIAGEDGKEYFVHVSGLTEGTKLREHDKVTFNVVAGDRGPKADHVKLDKAPVNEVPSEDSEEEISEESE